MCAGSLSVLVTERFGQKMSMKCFIYSKKASMKMMLELTSRQMDSGEAKSHAKGCPKTISDTYNDHESVKTLK